ncbi:hypothetical protein H0H92_006794 [Tricholoma furcatifolium]|nr:hypothetical protein H0H92_006794 [Tricholoma furcatifolium]
MSPSAPFKQLPHKLLVIPGPIEVSDEVLFANAAPSLSHVSPDFIKVFGETIRLTRQVHSTRLVEVVFTKDAQPFIISGSGTLGWDQVAANLVEPGEHALQTYGAKVDLLKAPLGTAASQEAVEDALKKKKYKVLTFTHVDTSTDCVCSVGSEEIRFDAWDLDIVLTAGQKGLGIPPGLSILIASQRAIKVFETRASPVTSYYASWKKWLPIMKAYEAGNPAYFATPPVNLIQAYLASLNQLVRSEISLEDRFRLHREASNRVKDAATALGLKQIALEPAFAANGMTTLYYPDGLGASDVLPRFAQRGLVIAGGLLGEIKDKYFRIGHMGVTVVDSDRGDVDNIIRVLQESIIEARTSVDLDYYLRIRDELETMTNFKTDLDGVPHTQRKSRHSHSKSRGNTEKDTSDEDTSGSTFNLCKQIRCSVQSHSQDTSKPTTVNNFHGPVHNHYYAPGTTTTTTSGGRKTTSKVSQAKRYHDNPLPDPDDYFTDVLDIAFEKLKKDPFRDPHSGKMKVQYTWNYYSNDQTVPPDVTQPSQTQDPIQRRMPGTNKPSSRPAPLRGSLTRPGTTRSKSRKLKVHYVPTDDEDDSSTISVPSPTNPSLPSRQQSSTARFPRDDTDSNTRPPPQARNRSPPSFQQPPPSRSPHGAPPTQAYGPPGAGAPEGNNRPEPQPSPTHPLHVTPLTQAYRAPRAGAPESNSRPETPGRQTDKNSSSLLLQQPSPRRSSHATLPTQAYGSPRAGAPESNNRPETRSPGKQTDRNPPLHLQQPSPTPHLMTQTYGSPKARPLKSSGGRQTDNNPSPLSLHQPSPTRLLDVPFLTEPYGSPKAGALEGNTRPRNPSPPQYAPPGRSPHGTPPTQVHGSLRTGASESNTGPETGSPRRQTARNSPPLQYAPPGRSPHDTPPTQLHGSPRAGALGNDIRPEGPTGSPRRRMNDRNPSPLQYTSMPGRSPHGTPPTRALGSPNSRPETGSPRRQTDRVPSPPQYAPPERSPHRSTPPTQVYGSPRAGPRGNDIRSGTGSPGRQTDAASYYPSVPPGLSQTQSPRLSTAPLRVPSAVVDYAGPTTRDGGSSPVTLNLSGVLRMYRMARLARDFPSDGSESDVDFEGPTGSA